MLEQIIALDKSMFEFVNQGLSNSFFDIVLPWIRNKYNWVPFYIALIVFMIWKYRKDGIYLILTLILVVIACDQISASIIKPMFARLRPCRTEDLVEGISMLPGVHCGGGFSFVSSHATNHFGMATFLAILFIDKMPWFARILMVWAASISFAQVYVGVHFPIDVICGGLLGMFIGWYGTVVFEKTFKGALK